MTTCSNCGANIDPDWTSCPACGRVVGTAADSLGASEHSPGPGPQVELISRGWSVVDLESEDTPLHDLLEEDDSSGPPLSPGSIEISVDDISFVASAETGPDAAVDGPTDSWAHLRPKGEMPALVRRVSIAARVVQTLAMITAVVTLGAGGVHFYLNTQLEASGRGEVALRTISDLQQVADIGLAVVAGTALVTILALAGWRWTVRGKGASTGKAGAVALLACIAGGSVVGAFYTLRRDTVTESIAANSLIILGLGLVVAAALIIVPAVGRVDRRVRL